LPLRGKIENPGAEASPAILNFRTFLIQATRSRPAWADAEFCGGRRRVGAQQIRDPLEGGDPPLSRWAAGSG
jgi:hypothetical protein